MAQVRGLIPTSAEVFLLVVVSGRPFALEAERVSVPPLSDRYAVQLVRKVAGRERYALAKERMPQVLQACAGNAFALKAEALRLLSEGGETAGHGHATEDTAPDPLRGAVRGVCDWLRPGTARLARLTALGGWPLVDARLAAAAAGVTPQEAAEMLAEAAEAQLLECTADDRFRFRPEVRRILADAAGAEDGIPACTAAVEGVLEHLLNRALNAAHAALPSSWRTEPALENGELCDGEAQGIAVLSAEAANLVHAVAVADEYRYVDTALRLARALWPLQLKAGHWDEVLPALRVATRCADRHRPDSPMAGALHFQHAHCLGELRQWSGAEQAARAAAACERAAGHLRGEASAVELLGLLELAQWRDEPAYEHFVEAEGILGRIGAGEEGAQDLPRALALTGRHRGRALRGMGRLTESKELLEAAVEFFATQGEGYNQARALTDLAETLHYMGDDDTALSRISEAERLLTPAATPHLRYLASLRQRCADVQGPQ
ncbi:tetratricopeptide repeat protein [Streptomyces sp. BH097]|uniref:tetratricopeptide repeat protein n=1 Tax=unclassified Streptomyces TaxID=2593676 RepID=UPI003BB4E50A